MKDPILRIEEFPRAVGLIDRLPAIGLLDPKFPHNVGGVVRAASCFGAKAVFCDGSRFLRSIGIRSPRGKRRLPREERMKASEVKLFSGPWWGSLPGDCTPVAVEMRPGAEPLPSFHHPARPIYIFGPEDGGLDQKTLRRCHRFVKIPSVHCLNLAAAVYCVLYDRWVKEGRWATRSF